MRRPVNGPGGGDGGTLAVKGLTVNRRRRPVLRALDWEVSSGGIRWVVGENGSGKSTLLGALSGRVRVAAGAIRYPWGDGIPEGALIRFHPAMEPPPEVRVQDWWRLADALVPRGVEASLAPELPPGQRLGDLSTGERKRLVLETLLGRSARLYLLDEPFEHLSPDAKRRLASRLESLSRRAVVVVATNQGSVAELGSGHGPGVLRLLGGGTWRRDAA